MLLIVVFCALNIISGAKGEGRLPKIISYLAAQDEHMQDEKQEILISVQA